MRTAEAKPTSVARSQKGGGPFFSKEGEGSFFGKGTQERSSFFKPAYSTSINGQTAIQPKLTIGQPNDKYEQEADTMADKVVQRLSMPEATPTKENTLQAKPLTSAITPLVQTKCTACEDEKLQKKEKEEEKDVLKGKLQKKPIFESNAVRLDEKNIQRKCAECEKEERVQKKTEALDSSVAPANIESSLNSSKGSGSPLSEDTREQMESSFGTDFSNVRIHDNSSSAELNKNLHAQAFTQGSDIYFNHGKYNTSSTAGKHLLAHELTHVVQQGGAGNSNSIAKKRIQRVSDYYWEPAPYNGTQEHSIISKEVISSSVVSEGPIPNAQTDRQGIGSAAGDGKKGSADYYTSTGNTIIGLYFWGKDRPSDLPVGKAKIGGKKFTGERAPLAYPGLTKDTPAHEARKIPKIGKVYEAPKDIKLGEMKPINSERAKEGVKQLEDYKKGIQIAADYVNISTGANWKPSPEEISNADLSSIVPERFKKNSSKPYIEKCILKGPQVAAGKIIDAKLQQERVIEARLVAGPDGTRPGIMLYAWVPIKKPRLRELPKRIVKLGKDVTDYIVKPLKAPIKHKPKAKMGSKKEMPGPKPSVPLSPAPKQRIQRQEDEYFDLKTWDKHRTQLIKDFKALKKTDDYKTTMYTGQNMEANKLIEKHMNIPQPAYEPQEKEAISGLKSIRFWANPLMKAFGLFKKLLGNLFNVVISTYEKLKGWIKGIANKFNFSSGKGGLPGAAFKAIFNVLKTVARVIISKVVDLLKLDVEKAIENKLNNLLQDSGLDKAKEYIDNAMAPIQKVVNTVEAEFAKVIAKYQTYFDEIAAFINKLQYVLDVIDKIRWVARAIACVSPPLVGCLWNLALSAIEKIASWVVETCWFRKKIAPIVLGMDFTKSLSLKLYQLVRGFLKDILPVQVGDFLFPEKESKPETAHESDIKCGSGSGDGEGNGESGGEPTDEQKAVIAMQEELKEDKFLALLDLLQKAKIDGATKMSAKRIEELTAALKSKSADDIKKMAEAYVKGDTSKVPVDIIEAIQKMSKDEKGEAASVPELDPAKMEQEVTAADARQDAAEVAKNLGQKEPTATEVASSGYPAAFFLDLLLNAKTESNKLIRLKKGKVEFNQGLRDKLMKMPSVVIHDLGIDVGINELKVKITDVKRDSRNEQEVTIVLDITVIRSKNPMIAIQTRDRIVHNFLWNPATQTPTKLQKPDVINTIIAGIQSNEPGLVDKEYDFSELGFKAKLTRINKVDNMAELYFSVTQAYLKDPGIYDFTKAKYISLQKGSSFMIKDYLSDELVPVMPKSEATAPPTIIQKSVFENGIESNNHGEIIQEKCEVCEQKEELRKKLIFESNAVPPDKETIQRKCAECEREEKLQTKSKTTDSASASSTIENNLQASKSSGTPLPTGTKEQMETSFGADFSNVRIHNNSSAVQMNKDLNAQAFAHGNDIYFNAGKYDTNSAGGKHLLAHELTHTIQQNGKTSIQRQPLTKKEILLRPNYQLTLNKTHNDSEYKLLTTIRGKGKIWVKENTLTVAQAPNQGDVHIIFERQLKLEKKDGSFYYIDYGGMTTITSGTANTKEIERIKKLKGKSLLSVTGNTTSFGFNFSGSEISGRLVNAETSVTEEQAANLGNTSLQEVMDVFYGHNYIAQYQSLDEQYFNKALALAKNEAPGRKGMITDESHIDFANGSTTLATAFDQKGVARISQDDFKVKVLPLPVKDTGADNEKFRLGFNDEVFILKQYSKNGQWFFIYTTDGRYGWVENWGVAYGAPEKDALLYKVKKGDSLWEIAKGQPAYTKWTAKPDEGFGKRTVINAIFFTNFMADRLMPFMGAVKSNISLKQASDSFQRLGENLKIRQDSVIWLPSKSFVSLLISKGQISSGKLIDSVLQDLEEFIEDVKNFTIGVAGFLAGIVVGFVKSIVDLLTGIVDLVEMIAKAIWSIISGKLLRSIISFIKNIQNLTVDELKEFFTQAASQFIGAIKTIIGDFVKKWTEGSTWDRWYFRGKVFGYILAEVVLALLTSGTSLAKWLSKLGKVGALIAEILLGKWDEVLLKVKEAKGAEKLAEGTKTAKAAKSAKLTDMTHQERKLLLNESTNAHKVADLEPRHLHAELDSAANARVAKSSRAGYEVEVVLDNGHKWRRNEKGTWCRFSEDPPTCLWSRKDMPEPTRAELEQLDKKAEEFKAAGTENILNKEDLDQLAITDKPPGSGKPNPRTTLGSFVHSKVYTQFCHWLDTGPGRKWLASNKLSHADFALDLPPGNIAREFAIKHPDFKMKPRADVVDHDNGVIHEIKPKGLEDQGFVESQQYAQWMNKYHPRDDGSLWRAGPTITYDGQKVFDAFKRFGFFEKKKKGG